MMECAFLKFVYKLGGSTSQLPSYGYARMSSIYNQWIFSIATSVCHAMSQAAVLGVTSALSPTRSVVL
ncbi:uncharacterized protein B0H18DRAFT_513778 [Fomitopsis serialis]|uniref:uncharacterized protein n=1 Tax=Fomitopsis serialis TaxID=139415 RepID=UPI002008CB0B|nr:uncharacterized protein B0H18DRAFT_513778 [Neoantrodia serialis]KAH9922504.1 hypothetical protein B0H18DRAFT_513778 [Neoantrodia serialis]